MPKPEPPRFFRPLCARLARQSERLNVQQRENEERTVALIEHIQRRLCMSVSEVRAEQKLTLREQRERSRTERPQGSECVVKKDKHQRQQNNHHNGTSISTNKFLLFFKLMLKRYIKDGKLRKKMRYFSISYIVKIGDDRLLIQDEECITNTNCIFRISANVFFGIIFHSNARPNK